jgi:hypothetical protein
VGGAAGRQEAAGGEALAELVGQAEQEPLARLGVGLGQGIAGSAVQVEFRAGVEQVPAPLEQRREAVARCGCMTAGACRSVRPADEGVGHTVVEHG